MTRSRRRRLPYVPEEDVILALLWPRNSAKDIGALIDRTASSVFQRAQRLGLEKAPGFTSDCTRRRWREGRHENSRKHCFRKGHVPFNKGARRPGWAPGRMAETQFKKGEMAGAAQHNYKPIGSLRIVYGNLERKVTDDPSIYPAKRWRPVHRLVWEAARGPVPRGHIVVFKLGQHTIEEKEITIDRLELVTHAENMRRNSIHNYPEELRQAIHAKAALTRAINRRQRNGH